MSKEKWEYKVRRVTDNMVSQERSLGKLEGSGDPGPIEREINKLVDDGWELMPIVLQTKMGSLLLLFKGPKKEVEREPREFLAV